MSASAICLSVGNGDATLIVDWDAGEALLVDCKSSGAGEVIKIIQTEGIRLTAAVVTHWDLDHYSGIARVARLCTPAQVHYNHDTLFPEGMTTGSRIKNALKALLSLKAIAGIELLGATAGDTGTFGAFHWEMLAPEHWEKTAAVIAGHRNTASAVMSVRGAGLNVLIGGDAVGSTWSRLLSSNQVPQVEVLRWPHHGAALHGDTPSNATAQAVIQAAQPQHVVLSVGASNGHGHPDPDIVALTHPRTICTGVTGNCAPYCAGTTSGRLCGGHIQFRVAVGAALQVLPWP